mmetsp:Transcript_3260/g.4134  ORF Transcript_3260/g.4134 Transcript_3260/m.4134 type:complete len:132 (-) Transcript_3260:34-429(-)
MVRIKTRWILSRYESKHSLSWRDLSLGLSKSIRGSKYGSDPIVVAQILNSTKVVLTDTASCLFLVRVEQKYVNIIKYALLRMKSIRRQATTVSIIHVSATTQQCQLAVRRLSISGFKKEPSSNFKTRVESL